MKKSWMSIRKTIWDFFSTTSGRYGIHDYHFGGMLASLIGGQLYDSLPVRTTLWIALAVGVLGAVIMFIGTRKRK